MKKQLLFIVMMLLPMVASADDSGACGENVTYTYVESTHILTISGTGAIADYKWDNHNHAPWYSYRTEIVKVIIENGVTSIGDEAIEECYNLTSIEIPNSVVSIGDRAIFGCFSLSILKIPGSVKSIGRFAFAACGLTSIEIPNSVTSINGNVFIDCDGLTSIKVANGNAVYDSRNNCNAIIETQSNTLICGCMNTIIPNDVTSIGGSAFENCDGLTSVEIPNSVTSIGNNAFFFTGLTSIVIPNSVKSIGRFAFSYCSGLTSVTISNSVTSIGDDAFSYCSGLTSVTIPNSVTSIGESAFQCCKGLTSITIPNSVTSIGDYAFSGCTGLIDVYCYAVVNAPRTGTHAFEFSTHATLHVPLEFYDTYMTTVPWSFFETIVRIDVDDIQIDGLRYELIGTNNAKVIKYMNNNQYCGDIVIPETIEYKGVNYSVTCIDEEAFGDCNGLTSVTIPNSVTSIEEWAFHGCRSLTSITIGSGVNDIYFNAFANCPKLTDIYCYAVRVPSIINPMHDYLTPIPWDSSMFGIGLTFHVPASSFNAYKMNPSWGDFNVVGIPGTEPTIYKLIYILDGVEYRTYDI